MVKTLSCCGDHLVPLIQTKFVSSNPVHGEMYSIQDYVIKFVSDLRQVGGFHWGTSVSEILLKVAFNTINHIKFDN